MKATLSHSRARFIVALALIAISVWAAMHVAALMAIGSVAEYLYSHWIFIFSFLVLTLTIAIAHREAPAGDATETTHLKATVVIPAYNEDPVLLYNCLESIMNQSRPVQEMYVIDDGSNNSDYTEVKQWFEVEAEKRPITSHWIRQPNGGKRHAQSQAFRRALDTDIFITVDSDSVLDSHAVNEIIRPFSNPKVQSVAGVVLARNNRVNLLARITDLLFVTGQLIDRSMMSQLGSVLVNSGGLAAYRASLVHDNLDAYLSETFFGRHIEFSDDSMLTLYALSRGRTIQQPTAFVFTEMPAKMSHHIRQQTRWMKGSFIRSWWRLRYLPLFSFGFLRQSLGWIQFTITTVLLVLILMSSPTIHPDAIPYIVLTPILIGYAQALRYLSVSRADESLSSQLKTYALTPIAVLWSYLVLRPIRIYASLTCLKPGWGTRQSVEVTQVEPQFLPDTVMNAAMGTGRLLTAPAPSLVATATPTNQIAHLSVSSSAVSQRSYDRTASLYREQMRHAYAQARHTVVRTSLSASIKRDFIAQNRTVSLELAYNGG